MQKVLILLLAVLFATAAGAQDGDAPPATNGTSTGTAEQDLQSSTICSLQGAIDFADFSAALSTRAQGIRFGDRGAKAHPLRQDIDLVTKPMDAAGTPVSRALTYRVWVSRQPLSKRPDYEPRELVIRQVTTGPLADETSVRVGLADGAEVKLWRGPSHLLQLFFFDVSVLLAACDPDGGALIYTATGHKIVTTIWAGMAAVVLAALIFVFGMYIYYRLVRYRRWLRMRNEAAAEDGTVDQPAEADAGKPSKPPSFLLWFKSCFLDFRGAMSLSFFQVFLFFVSVYFSFAVVLGRTFAFSNFSAEILMLLGITAASGVVGKTVDVNKDRLEWDNWAWLEFDIKAFDRKSKVRPHWGQLVSSNGSFDVYRFQALCFSVLVALGILFVWTYSLEEFALPAGVLSLLGLSQVTYVAGKFATAPTMKDFDARATELRTQWNAGKQITGQEAKKFANEFSAALGMTAGPEMVQRLQDTPPKPATGNGASAAEQDG